MSTGLEPVIEIRDIRKAYQLGEGTQMYGSLRDALTGAVRNVFRNPRRPRAAASPARDASFWALKGINLDIHKGETVAIIGSNGAGKSTLLKIIARITDPTEGQIRVKGRMGSLLEVGTGFHPELTGRENIYLNGGILGMRKVEIDSKFEDIVEFAGISRFLDTPVKRYSSGMYVRLAFSIAAHVDPDILIIDEVLAVGDVAFQKKCLGRMAEACARARTILFVSHNLAVIESLCSRGVVLDRGEVVYDGPSKDAVRFYLEQLGSGAQGDHSSVVDLSVARGRSPKYRPHLRSLELFTTDNKPLRGDLPIGAPLKAVISFELEDLCTSFDASIAFDTLGGQRVCTAHSAYEPGRIHEVRKGVQTFVCEIPSLTLVPGQYKLHVGLDIAGGEADWVEEATQLTVVSSDYYGTGIVPTKGLFLVQNRWKLEHSKEEIVA